MVDPAAKLEEELIIRPTSETIIWNTYKNWINSYRDLGLRKNESPKAVTNGLCILRISNRLCSFLAGRIPNESHIKISYVQR